VNPLFPATPDNHYMVGFGYALGKTSSVDMSLAHAQRVTTTGGLATSPAATTRNAETNWQLMYSNRF
jgi:hypothetical protein